MMCMGHGLPLIGSDQIGSDWIGSDQIGSDRIGSVSPLPDILKMAKGSKILVWRGLVY